MRCTLLPSFEYRRERWQNGRGWTREILRGAGERWAWRCSVAEIDQDGAFSLFPGRRRLMVLLQGEGLELQGQDPPISLSPPHGQAVYAGDLALSARLRDGPCRALNLIWDPSRCEALVLHRPLVGSMLFFSEAEAFWLVHVLAGEASAGRRRSGLTASVGDSLLLKPEPGSSGGRLLIDGGGEVLLLRLRALTADAAPAAP